MPRKPLRETPVERIFREVSGYKMPASIRRILLRKPRPKLREAKFKLHQYLHIIVGEAFRNDFWTGWLKEATDKDFFLYKRLDTRTTGENNATDIVGWGTSGFFAKHIESNEGSHDAAEVAPGFIPSATPVPGARFRSRSMACGLWWDRTSIRRAINTDF